MQAEQLCVLKISEPRVLNKTCSIFICMGLQHQTINFGNTELVAVVCPQFLITHTFLISSFGSYRYLIVIVPGDGYSVICNMVLCEFFFKAGQRF